MLRRIPLSEADIPRSILEERFRMYPESGRIERKDRWHGWVQAGHDVSKGMRSRDKTYTKISVPLGNGTFTLITAHHLMWIWVYGERLGRFEIDHINGDCSDNRISNLRRCTVGQNQYNKRRARNNTSGYKWVHFEPKSKKWDVRVSYRCDGKRKFYAKRFDDKETAYSEACKAAKTLHGEFYNPG